jgi:DNA-binding response OmpR family regulator
MLHRSKAGSSLSGNSDGSSQPNHARRATVLVVDDEATLRETVAYNLEREGFGVELASDGKQALEIARSAHPDLVILDIMLPQTDGLQVCRTLRGESTVPILLLSARSEEFDRVLGLELGADDYLTKPFAMRELLARVRAMLRRVKMQTDDRIVPTNGLTVRVADSDDKSAALKAGDVEIDLARREARVGDQELFLKPKEFDLLTYLVRHPGIVLSRDALLREVWGYEYPIDTRTVDVHVRGLRQKLEQDPSNPQRIETVRGYGYRFVEPRD